MARQAAEDEGAARLYDALGPALFRYALNARGLLIESLWNPGSDWYGQARGAVQRQPPRTADVFRRASVAGP